MSQNLPIVWEDKVNNPELVAFLQQYGSTEYLAAAEINQLRDAINELFEANTSDSLFTSDIVVSLSSGKTAGKYTNGQTIPLTGKTPQEAFNDIFVETLFPTLSAPSLGALALNQSTTQEFGATLASLVLSATFNRGSINPQYAAANAFRSGLPTAHLFTSSIGPVNVTSNSLNVSNELINYVVQLGNNLFSAQVSYTQGTQPKDSAGNNFGAALAEGNSNTVTVAIQGILPYFFGKTSSLPTVNQALIDSGTKAVALSNGNITVNFNATSEYLWFAIPETSTSKTVWYVNALNNGSIGSPSDLFGAFTALSVDSAIWTDQNYKVYVSNYPTSVASIQLNN